MCCENPSLKSVTTNTGHVFVCERCSAHWFRSLQGDAGEHVVIHRQLLERARDLIVTADAVLGAHHKGLLDELREALNP